MSFTLQVAQNPYLPAGVTEVHAIVSVTAGSALSTAGPAVLTEVIVIDVSTSMDGDRMEAARSAAAAAIDQVSDGAWFAVIAGNHLADVVVPLTRSDPATRQRAKSLVAELVVWGGTVIGNWLLRANELFATRPGSIHHCLLLTDGKDEGEPHEQLAYAIDTCRGTFTCDCRGVGTDWMVNELREISSALLGTVDIVPEPAGLAAEFARVIEGAMQKQVGSVAIRVWTPQGSHLEYVKEVYPVEEDRTSAGVAVNPLTLDFPTGAWAPSESRDYHLAIAVPVAGVGEERLAARVSMVVDGTPSATALVKAIWTSDGALSAKICPEVAHYTGQTELADAIEEGLAALAGGDRKTATLKLGTAVRIATEVHNTQTLQLLEKVVEVTDARTGTVKVRDDAGKADTMALDSRRTVTVRLPGASS